MPGLSIWANLALGIVQVLNLVLTQVKDDDMRNDGFRRAILAFTELVNARVTSMKKIDEANEAKADEELIKELTE